MPRKSRKNPRGKLEFTPVYSPGGIILESQRLRRRFILGIAALLAFAGLAVALFPITWVPGEIEITSVYLKREPQISWLGARFGYGRSGRTIETRKIGAALYNSRGDYLGLLEDVSVVSDGSTKRLPVYYSWLWRSAVCPRNSQAFLSVGIAAALLLASAAGFAFLYRRHLKLQPVVPNPPPGSSR
jgi:hypothetical protein